MFIGVRRRPITGEGACLELCDLHASDGRRICPIETPEGPNIGIINLLSIFACLKEFRLIEAPDRVATDRK
jgi:DNA-directed RNA polymerase subunit beta